MRNRMMIMMRRFSTQTRIRKFGASAQKTAKYIAEEKAQMRRNALIIWFQEADKDSNGTLDRFEVHKMLKFFGVDENQVDSWFAAMDKDRNGRLTFDEFELACSGQLQKVVDLQQINAMYN